MSAAKLARIVWFLGGLALLLGGGRDTVLGLIPAPRALPRLDGATGQPWMTGGFGLQGLPQGALPAHMEHASSWVGSDDWQGRAETAWFRTSRRIVYVAVAGYPNHRDCKLWAEFRDVAGAITRVDCRITDAREEWSLWQIRRPAGAIAVRLIGEDNAKGACGWIAFSHPFRACPPELATVYVSLQLATTLALVLTLVWGPGLLWCPADARHATRLVWFLAAGPLTLALLGIVLWSTSRVVAPQTLGSLAIAALWLAIGRRAHRRGFDLGLSRGLARMLAVTALVVVAVVAKSTYSVGPDGELFRGTISRNLALSDRIDSRFSFYVVQAATLHYAPAAPETEKFFYPWTFFSRGPLAGLAAIPVVAATHGHPPDTFPEQRFSPFDSYGFTAYRLTLIALASTVVIALFLLLASLVGEAWALAGGGLLALSPFGVHEIMFTWPKWPATAWVIASFALAHTRRPASAGLALGVGFLFHPLALLWSPWIGLWAAARHFTAAKHEPARRRLIAGFAGLARCATGACLVVLPWMAIGAVMPHLPDTPFAGQGGFLRYWIMADWHYANWDSWWRTRWMNFANTFVPLHLVFHPPSFNHFKLGSAYETSTAFVKFPQVWWNSLPFALGLGLWIASLGAFPRLLRTLRSAALLFLVLPVLFITAYWGMDPLGLMRECAHPFFVALIALLVVLAARETSWLRRLLRHRAVPWLQLPETLLMLWLGTLTNTHPWPAAHSDFDAVYPLINVVALAGAAGILSRARSEIRDTPDVPPPSDAPAPAPLPLRRRVEWAVLGCAALALLIGPTTFDRILGKPLATAAGATGLPDGAFKSPGVFQTTDPAPVPTGVATRGSWLGSDEFQGSHETDWYRARGTVTLMVAGYPALAPNRLELQIRRRDGTEVSLPYPGPDPGETWRPWRVHLPARAATFRIRATDGSSAPMGWLAFSEPFADVSYFPRQLWPLLQLATATCLSLVLIYGPGLLWFRRRARPALHLLFALALGPLLLGGLGLVCWLLGGWIAPPVVARVGIVALLGGIAPGLWQTRRSAVPLPSGVAPILFAATLLVGFAVAKANVSFGPAGELFRDTVSRTLAVGGHSDSRMSYHAVQLVANHHGPFSKAAEGLYSPWSFASRGPLGGLIAAPVVLATGGQPALDAAHQPWQPFDRQGFAVYRISQIVLASLAACAVFAATAAILPAPWPLFAGVVVLLTPFFVHELYFTWPKLPTVAFVLASFAFAHTRRPFIAAGLLGLAYFFHPLALFSIPFLALWLLARNWREARGLRRFLPTALFGTTVLAIVLPWMLLGRLAPLRNGSQTVFFDYFRLASGTLPATAADWWHARWSNFANTFLPFHLFTVDRLHESINSVYAPSDAWVRTSFLWWNTLPFALGVPAFLLLTAAFFSACRRAFAIALVTFIAPAVLMIVYWGAADTGLMRHCGHVLFLSFIVLGVWSLATRAGDWRERSAAAFLHPAVFAWRAAEILLVAFGTTLLHQRPDLASRYGWNDLFSLALAVACLAGAVFLLAKTSRSLRSTLFPPTT